MLHVKFKAHWGDMGNTDPKILCAPLAPGHFNWLPLLTCNIIVQNFNCEINFGTFLLVSIFQCLEFFKI